MLKNVIIEIQSFDKTVGNNFQGQQVIKNVLVYFYTPTDQSYQITKFLKSLEWRKKWNIDKISEWDPPELLKTHFPCGCCGFDTDGSPIVITVFDGFDVVGLLNCFEKRDVQKRTIQVLEYYMKLGEEHNSNQVNSIIDLEGFTLRPYTWRPG